MSALCTACPRNCGADREKAVGVCGAPNEFRLARAALHMWEEPCISGTAGSGAVFFSGCSLKCVYCQNFEISTGNKGKAVSDEQLIGIFESLIEQGAANINLVNPTHYAPRLAKLLSQWKCPVPVVYNSSGYESVETLRMLDGLIDIYLPDFKYIRADKAQRYSKAADYPDIAMAALSEMRRQQPKDVFDGDMMKKGLIIRHLILPANTNSSIEVLDYLAANFSDTYISLMAQYTPCGKLDNYPEISRPITEREYEKVAGYAADLGLEKVFLQNLDSSSKKFIPAFDFTGIM